VEILLYYDREIFYKIDERIRITAVCKETGTTNLIKNCWWIRKYFKNRNGKIISFLAPFNMVALVATIFLNKIIIVCDRSDPYHAPETAFLRIIRNVLYRRANGIVLQTQHSKGYFSKYIQNKSVVIFNPVDLGDKLGSALISPKKKEIVSVGRLMGVKNHEMLIRAFGKIHVDFPEYKLVIYGDGPNRVNLEKMIRNMGLNNCVSLPGTFKDIFERIKASSLFVFTSYYEGMPNALLEAMCLGLPVISTKVAGATDLIQDGENGILVDVGDEDALAIAMKRLINNRDERDKIANNAVAIAKELEVSRITSEWVNFINSCKQ
jgi:glycosyltransferase involved in cell wall biosynthesis